MKFACLALLAFGFALASLIVAKLHRDDFPRIDFVNTAVPDTRPGCQGSDGR